MEEMAGVKRATAGCMTGGLPPGPSIEQFAWKLMAKCKLTRHENDIQQAEQDERPTRDTTKKKKRKPTA